MTMTKQTILKTSTLRDRNRDEGIRKNGKQKKERKEKRQHEDKRGWVSRWLTISLAIAEICLNFSSIFKHFRRLVLNDFFSATKKTCLTKSTSIRSINWTYKQRSQHIIGVQNVSYEILSF